MDAFARNNPIGALWVPPVGVAMEHQRVTVLCAVAPEVNEGWRFRRTARTAHTTVVARGVLQTKTVLDVSGELAGLSLDTGIDLAGRGQTDCGLLGNLESSEFRKVPRCALS